MIKTMNRKTSTMYTPDDDSDDSCNELDETGLLTSMSRLGTWSIGPLKDSLNHFIVRGQINIEVLPSLKLLAAPELWTMPPLVDRSDTMNENEMVFILSGWNKLEQMLRETTELPSLSDTEKCSEQAEMDDTSSKSWDAANKTAPSPPITGDLRRRLSLLVLESINALSISKRNDTDIWCGHRLSMPEVVLSTRIFTDTVFDHLSGPLREKLFTVEYTLLEKDRFIFDFVSYKSCGDHSHEDPTIYYVNRRVNWLAVRGGFKVVNLLTFPDTPHEETNPDEGIYLFIDTTDMHIPKNGTIFQQWKPLWARIQVELALFNLTRAIVCDYTSKQLWVAKAHANTQQIILIDLYENARVKKAMHAVQNLPLDLPKLAVQLRHLVVRGLMEKFPQYRLDTIRKQISDNHGSKKLCTSRNSTEEPDESDCDGQLLIDECFRSSGDVDSDTFAQQQDGQAIVLSDDDGDDDETRFQKVVYDRNLFLFDSPECPLDESDFVTRCDLVARNSPTLDLGQRAVNELQQLALAVFSNQTYHQRTLLEQKTCLQSSSILWNFMRLFLMTASRLYDISTCIATSIRHKRFPSWSISRNLLKYPNHLDNLPSLLHGRKMEPKVFDFHFQNIEPNSHWTVCGLFIHPDVPYVGASPDGITMDHKSIIEIKCHMRREHDIKRIPNRHLAQMYCQLDAVGAERCQYVNLCGTNETRFSLDVRTVTLDRDFLDTIMENVRLYYTQVHVPYVCQRWGIDMSVLANWVYLYVEHSMNSAARSSRSAYRGRKRKHSVDLDGNFGMFTRFEKVPNFVSERITDPKNDVIAAVLFAAPLDQQDFGLASLIE